MLKRIKKWFLDLFHKKKKTIAEAEKILKTKTKNELIDVLAMLASRINKNNVGIDKAYRKELRSYPKRKLIRTILLLEVYKNRKEFIKIINQKTETSPYVRTESGILKPTRGNNANTKSQIIRV